MGVLCLPLFLVCIIFALPSFAIMLKRKRELVALLLSSYGYLVTVKVQWLFLMTWWVGLEFMIVVFPDHTHQLLGLVTKMPPCSNKIKQLLNILWNQKTKMPPIPYMELTFKILLINLVCTFKGRSHNAELLLQELNRLQSSIFIYSSVRERKKMSSHICYRKTDVVYCLLHSRL